MPDDHFIYKSPTHYKESKIVVQTRMGTNIENSRTHEFTPFELGQYRENERKYRNVQERTKPSPAYNCHGLTFASRRTCIDSDTSVQTILAEDGYVPVPRNEVLPGDIIIYVGAMNVIEHSGVVVEVTTVPPQMYRVVSKWGKDREVIHWDSECPYASNNLKFYRVEKWDT